MRRISNVTIVTEEDVSYSLGYFLLQKNGLYGVSVELVKKGVTINKEDVLNIWNAEEDALKFINFLAENSVTPTTLVEILDEFAI